MVSARYHLARWNLLHAQACLEVTEARFRKEDAAALEVWADICAMRRETWASEWELEKAAKEA